MPIYPINSTSISFGENKKQKNYLLPSAAGGLLLGTILGKKTEIKTNTNNIDDFIKTVEKKLPMSIDIKKDFDYLKNKIYSFSETANKKMEEMGISKEQKFISKNELFNKIIHPNQPNKNMDGLNSEIKWVEGEVDALKNKPEKIIELNKKTSALKEKIKIKNLIEETQGENISIDKLKNIYRKKLDDNIEIKSGIDNVNRMVKKFNKQKLFLFSSIGLISGTILYQLFKTNKNK